MNDDSLEDLDVTKLIKNQQVSKADSFRALTESQEEVGSGVTMRKLLTF